MPRGAPAQKRLLTTVLFTDIVGSTQRAQELGDRAWRQLLTTHHRIVRAALKRHRGREIDTAGDGFFATFDQPADSHRMRVDMIDRLRAAGIDIRTGVHMGEVEVMGDKVGGIAVHIGARVMSKAEAGQVLVSGTVRDLMAGSEIAFDDAGVQELKGVATPVHLYAVRPRPIDARSDLSPGGAARGCGSATADRPRGGGRRRRRGRSGGDRAAGQEPVGLRSRSPRRRTRWSGSTRPPGSCPEERGWGRHRPISTRAAASCGWPTSTTRPSRASN